MKVRVWARRRGAAPLPRTLDRRGLYILPTRQGLVFALVLAATLVGAVNYQNNMAFLLAFLLAGLALAAMVHGYRNLLGLTVTGIGAQPVFAGRQARIAVRLAAGSRDRPAVRVALDRAAAASWNLEAQQEAAVEIDLPTRRRGLLPIGRLVVSSRYPMGLFRVWATIDPQAVCLVYPQPLAASLPLELGSDGAGTGQAGPGIEDFHGVTPYQPGDPPRHLHWKSLARGQGVFTKRFDERRGSGGLLDWFAVPEPDPERRVSILCHAVLDRERRKQSYGLRLPGRLIRPALGRGHRHRCLEALAHLSVPGGSGP
jgi:uncharacterized protein (DUF58 family)